MKPFKFSLESVLTVRSREEDVARQSYAEALAFQARTQESLNQALVDLEQLHGELSEKRTGVSRRDDQILFIQAIRQQRFFCDTLTQRLSRAAQLLEVRMQLWMEARRKTQVLERLKEKKRDRHDAEVQRLAEREVEDLITARWRSGGRALVA
jgi:flagellar export protein FliJ